jgi:hypothetical protein
MFKNKRAWSVWNSRFNGKPAGSINKYHGYIEIRIKRYGLFLAHRLVFLYMDGDMPEQVDHIRIDYRWANLRAANYLINSRNHSKSKANTSGITGVYWCNSRSRWIAGICVNRKTIRLGRYKDIQDAIVARKKAEKKHGFHSNHGKQ